MAYNHGMCSVRAAVVSDRAFPPAPVLTLTLAVKLLQVFGGNMDGNKFMWAVPCLPACLPACLPVGLAACQRASVCVCVLACLPAREHDEVTVNIVSDWPHCSVTTARRD